MKKTILPVVFSLGIVSASAQTYPLFNTSQNIDVGNIKAAHLVHGDMWWKPDAQKPACEFPKGSGKHISFATSLWIGGYDRQHILKMAAQTYRNSGTDFWPGPCDTSAMTDSARYANSSNWARIWKVSRSQVDLFRQQTVHTLANMPIDILQWPATGNPYAAGNNGPLNITHPMAPFVDVDNDGIYNPVHGDYPLIKGDQMLWWVINDLGPGEHPVTGTLPIGLEVQTMAYAYGRGTLADEMIFYEYQLINKGTNNLSNFRFALMADMDNGYPFDDYSGFDSSRRLACNYNGRNVDGNGDSTSYGKNPPAAGVAVMELPGDSYGHYASAGSFMFFQNTMTGTLAMNRLMNSMYPDGTTMSNGSRYQFTLDEECQTSIMPDDTRFILASNDLTFNPGDSRKIGLALVAVRASGGCPYFDTSIIQRATDSAYKYYWNPPALQTTAVGNPLASQQLRIYPNPADDILDIDFGSNTQGTLAVYNAVGQVVMPPKTFSGSKARLAVGSLPKGVYTIRVNENNAVHTGAFVKD